MGIIPINRYTIGAKHAYFVDFSSKVKTAKNDQYLYIVEPPNYVTTATPTISGKTPTVCKQ